MNCFFKYISAILLVCVIITGCASCNTSNSQQKETESNSTSNTVTKAVTETDTPTETDVINPLKHISSVSIYRDGSCHLYTRSSNNSGATFEETTRFIYKTKNKKGPTEITVESIRADGTGTNYDDNDELVYLMIVFQKDHKLTDKERANIQRLGIDYMFEK